MHQQKGDFLRLNHYNVKPNSSGDWSRLETTYWKLLVEDWTKAGNKGTWMMYRLWMPEGENQPNNAMRVDAFPDWNSMVHGANALVALWPKLHPGTDTTEVFDWFDRVRSRYDTEISRVRELVTASGAGGRADTR